MKKYIALVILCCCQYVFATGPSHATLKIVPLSINEQGELLYRYKSITNPMGGHYLEPVFYGTGFFKDGKFTSLKEQVIEADNDNSNLDYKKYSADLAKLDQWLNAPCESSDLTNGFASCNLKEHAVNRLMTGAELKQTYGIDITKAVGYFLLPGILQANENNSIYVAYAVNGFIVAEFDEFTGCSEGVSQHNIFIAQRAVDEFNHFDEHDYGYECVNLTGIVMNK